MQVWLVNSDGAHDREILNFGTEVKTYGGWYSDSQQVVFLTETPTHKKLGIWSLESGEVRWLIDDPLRNLEHAFVPHNSAEIVIYEVQDARTQSSLLNPITGSERKITLPSGNFNLIGTLENGDCIGVLYSAQQPTDIVRFSPDAPEQITSISRVWSRTALTGNDFAKAENFRWSSVDDMAIHGWLYRAKGEPKGTIVYVHGGPTAHSTDQINNQIQFFVRAGFNVLDPNYRGSTGYHQPFKEAIKVDGWGGREQDDIATGVQALIDAGIAQPGRVGITGTSYGGYSSWCAITRFPPELFAASAPVCGMTDLVVDYETTRPDLRPYSEEMLGGRPDQIPQKYHERSPINYVQNIKGRLLIVQGLQDPNVTPENVRTVTAALQTAHVEYGLLVFEDEGHGIIKPKNQGMLYQRLLDFFETM
jgi:dipeptidyl aminopeptidase/acylaminoacyl peptidase